MPSPSGWWVILLAVALTVALMLARAWSWI
jgi:hypothetical protein